MRNSVEHFSPRTALQQLDLLAETAAAAGTDSEHLAAYPDLYATFVREVVDELATAAALAIGLFPIAPTMACQLWNILGCSGRVEDAHWDCPDAYLPRTVIDLDVDRIGFLFTPEASIES